MGFSDVLGGFADVLRPDVLLLAFLGCLAGTLVGMLPGLGPVSAIAILFPLTTYLDPAAGIIVLAAIYYGAMYGGSTSAILLNIPGEVSSVPAAIEGYALTRQGRAGAALATAAIVSFIAGIAGTVGLILIGPHLARFALDFGPPEMLGLLLFSLLAIAGLSSGRVARGIGMGVLGMILASVGLNQSTGEARLTFGSPDLMQGLNVVPVMIGLFGLGEVLSTLRGGTPRLSAQPIGRILPNRDELRRGTASGARGTVIGFFLGLIPGLLPSITSFLSYAYERRRGERRGDRRFGNGAIEGIGGPEAANNASAMSGFMPLFALGIPTGPTMALILAALLVYGVVPGPTMFTADADLTAAIIASFFVANVILLILNLPLVGLWVRIARIPYGVLAPIVVASCLVGAYTDRSSVFDVWTCLVFGLVGWGMATWGLPIAPLVMGFILGPRLELALQQTVALDLTVLLESPIFLGFAGAALGTVLLGVVLRRREVPMVEGEG
ncbi:tripartite tricarboxylate transporter permease [Streptomyces mayteni]